MSNNYIDLPVEGGVSALNTLIGAVTLAAGTGITITPSGNTLTIAGSLAGANTALSNLAPTTINQNLNFIVSGTPEYYVLGFAGETATVHTATFTPSVGAPFTYTWTPGGIDINLDASAFVTGFNADATAIAAGFSSYDVAHESGFPLPLVAYNQWAIYGPGGVSFTVVVTGDGLYDISAGNGFSPTYYKAAGITTVDKVTNMADPTAPQDAATKHYVDISIAAIPAAPTILVFNSNPSAGGAVSEALTVTGLLTTDTILSVTQRIQGGATRTSLSFIGWDTVVTNGLTAQWVADPGAGAVLLVAVKR